MSCVAVPSEMKASPGRTAPMPTAPTAASPPPAATIAPRGKAEFVGGLRAERRPGLAAFRERRDARLHRGRWPPAPPATSAALRFVKPPRAGGVAHVGALLAGQAKAQIVLGQQHAGDCRRRSAGSWRWSQSSLGAVKPAIGLTPTTRARSRWRVPQLGGFREGARVVVQHRGPQRAIVGADEHRAVHLSGKADRADGGESRGALRFRSPSAPAIAETPRLGILLGPQRMRVVGAIGAYRRSDNALLRADQHRLERRSPAIDAERDHRPTVAEKLNRDKPDRRSRRGTSR